MNPSPLISILMPAYNAERFISEAIHSILRQDHPNWELLILNDASTDKTPEIIAGFADTRIRVFHHTQQKGYLMSCNDLFQKANGDFLTFLDADDACPENRLSRCLAEFARDPELDFLSTDHTRTDVVGNVISENTVVVDYLRYAADPHYNPTICCATLVFKRELLDATGGYRTFFQHIGGEDYFWLWELSKHGKGQHLQEQLYAYRQHSNQSSISHSNPLHLFFPELLTELKKELLNTPWDDRIVERVAHRVETTYLHSDFEVSLRKAQIAMNRKEPGLFGLISNTFLRIRKPEQLKRSAYLVYSWAARKLRHRTLQLDS